jgi:hypothetical protein
MAIASLSTISPTKFKGGSNLTGTRDEALSGVLNTIIAGVNAVITGLGDGSLDTLAVGTAGGGSYYGSSDSWISIDGTNPPTFSRIRMLDETTGLYVVCRVNNGDWGFDP